MKAARQGARGAFVILNATDGTKAPARAAFARSIFPSAVNKCRVRLAVNKGLAASRCSAARRNVGVPGRMETSLAVHPGEATSGRLAGDK